MISKDGPQARSHTTYILFQVVGKTSSVTMLCKEDQWPVWKRNGRTERDERFDINSTADR